VVVQARPQPLPATQKKRLTLWGAMGDAGGALWACIEREFFIDNLLVRIHFIIVIVRWTGLAPWEFEFPFPGSFTSTFLQVRGCGVRGRPCVPHLDPGATLWACISS